MTDPGRVDVLVVGGGPVGLAAAIEARLAGLGACVVEARAAPVDKACGEGLMPGAVAALTRLGVEVRGHPIEGIAYLAPGRSVRTSFRDGGGLGVRRTELVRALAARADELGVERVRARVGDLEVDADGVRAAGVRARWLLAADGLHSPVRHRLGLDRPARGPARYGLRRHHALAPWSDDVEVHWAADAEAYVTPVADDCVGVALLGGPGGGFDERLLAFPALRDRLAGALPASSTLGAGPLRQVAARRVSSPVLLVGDAAGYVDALTGEGVSVGLASARAAVAAVAAGHPEQYERAWKGLSRRYRWLTAGLLQVAGRGWSRPLVVPAAERFPGVFSAVVDALAEPPRAWSAPEVGRRR